MNGLVPHPDRTFELLDLHRRSELLEALEGCRVAVEVDPAQRLLV